MGWDYQSLRDASFQRSANWNALFDPSTGQFDESFTVSGDDEVHLSGYEYHPTNTNLWKTPLEEALEELFPLDYLDTTGDPPSSTDPSASDQSDGGDLDGYAGDYQGDLFGEEQGGSSGSVYYTAYSGSGQSTSYSSSSNNKSGWGGFWDKVQLGLDVVGCIPVIGEAADGVNGVILLARGDHVGAGLAFASMIPVYGDIVGKGGKVARYAAKYGDEAAEAGQRLVHRASNKVATPAVKASQFGPRIADPVPTNGVPKNWSREDIQDAIDDYRASIATRKAELQAFDLSGSGSATKRLAHARRITEEEAFLASLFKALENRK
ncbi:MAG: hypothetical protein KatS3mg111_3393 [Pirellulaceae bacterium]|nr:MAG: hypothetical protein KatS3mg111_3393 [Pirellulaceae bacterium]